MTFYGKASWILTMSIGVLLTSLMVSCSGTAFSGGLIEYRRTGGFVGLDDRLTIDADREATLARKVGHYEFVLDQATFERLLREFDQIEFSKLKREYLPADTCCDLIEYKITYKGHTVRTMDTAVPESLWPVLAVLDEIINTRGKP
jgi:hypothetical protein